MSNPKFQAMHYAFIAGVMFSLRSKGAPWDECIQSAISALADAFEEDNPRFERAKFLEACGRDPGSID